MKHILLTISFLVSALLTLAQNYGNEWIPFAPGQSYSLQQYFKVQVWQEGIYRIDKSALQAVQVPLSGIDPRNFQIFHNGSEIPIYVHNEQYGVIDSTDYIEFYGNKNDGAIDVELYDDPSHQTHPKLSLVNDTAVYFLTWNSSVNNKRIVEYANTNYASYLPESYCIQNEHLQFIFQYNIGPQDANGLSEPTYDEGEGWASQRFNEVTAPLSAQFNTLNAYNAGPAALFKTKVLGANSRNHDVIINLDGTPVANLSFGSYNVQNVTSSYPASSIGNSVDLLYTPIANSDGTPNYITVSFASLDYPHTFSFSGEFGNQTIRINANSFGDSRLDFTNVPVFQTGTAQVYVFGNDSIYRVLPTLDAGTYKTLIPNSGIERTCYMTSSGGTLSNSGTQYKIEPVSKDPTRFGRFLNFEVNIGDYLIITHKSLLNEASTYANYRSSTGFSPLTIDIDELYDQFAYGVKKHPLSIKNFNHFIYDKWSPRAKHMYLLGKAITSTDSRFNQTNFNRNLIPTYGVPPSDQILSSGIADTSFRTAISMGRLAARTGQDVTDYLNKVIDYESAPEDEWMKNVLHFGGGITSGEQQSIAYFLSNYESIIEDTCFGGEVTSYFKTSSSPIQINQSQALQDKIDNGVSLMTFFAHASGSSFDISTDVPANYSNKDKYPVIVANSCFVGDIHTQFVSASEDFVLIPEKGAIAFIAEPFLGYQSPLFVYTSELYKNFAYKNYGKPIGTSIKNTIDSVLTDNITLRSVCLLMTLHGDPALPFNAFEKPDYRLQQADVFYTPAVVTTEIDSFEINVVATNIGKAVNKPSFIEIIRQYPSGPPDSVITITIGPVAYKDTFKVKLPVDVARGAGINNIIVTLDAFNSIDEGNELNNSISSILVIQSSDVNPVYPYEYAIVPSNDITLKATTANLSQDIRNYIFEIDTTDAFSSPLKLNTQFASSGGVLEWDLPIILDSNLVHYWRVGLDSVLIDPINYRWNESSFIHIPGKTGWSQAHYFQFKKDQYTNVVYDKPNRDFDFITTQSFLNILNTMDPFSAPLEYTINSIVQDYGACQIIPSMHIAVIDSVSLEPWETKDYNFGQTNTFDPNTNTGTCRNRSEKYFIFRANSSSQLLLMRDMLNSIPNGNYVAAWSVFGGTYTVWPSTVNQAFTDLGATAHTSIQNYQPYIFFVKKGDINSVIETVGDSLTPNINISTTLGGNWTQGFINSTTIGPSTNWNTIEWDTKMITLPAKDSISLNVFGKNVLGLKTELISNVPLTNNIIQNLNSIIDPDIYPYLELQVYLQDDSLRTPPQMDKWQVYYDEVPEAALNPLKHFIVSNINLQEGDNINLEMAVENISDLDMDSMLVDFFVINSSNQKIPIKSERYRSLPSGDTLHAKVSLNSLGYSGTNTLWIEANPSNDQPEQYHFNNLAGIQFTVDKDITNPILDVTFDGIRILNGDIVSANPHIIIDLHDENMWLALNDTNDFRVFLATPGGNNIQLNFETSSGIRTDGNKLKWVPAQLPANSFKMELEPAYLVDGVYTLTVEASDRSGNLSGVNNYSISFEVVNESTITEVLNYPNPFSTSTRFVFTLTGSQIPEYFKIQILTISGKVVREITQDELGPLHIGRNITQYAWDGRDEFGDQLANGVYLYRVSTSLNGSSVQKRETDAGKYFKNGWGKMYLLR